MGFINENEIYKLFRETPGIARLHVAQIDELPRADVVDVVRCKDCAYRYTKACGAKHERADMDFCSHGLRKEDGNEFDREASEGASEIGNRKSGSRKVSK